MPIKKSAMKELKKSKKRHLRNISTISLLKTLAKTIENLIQEKKVKEAKARLNEFESEIKKAAAKGIVRKNLSSRKISRLSKKLHLASKA
jgi:small subunit ribosomal protein S20